jgi:hypothetical protein
MLVTLPCTLLLLDFWPLRRLRFASKKFSLDDPPTGESLLPVVRWWDLVVEKIPLLVLSILAAWLAADSMKYTGIVVPFELIPLGLRIQNALVSALTYTGKIIWPAHLAIFYPYPGIVSPWHTGLAVMVLFGITAYACLGLRKHPYIIVGWLWFLGTLAPVCGIIQVGLWPALADRWAYVPAVGLFVTLVWGGWACLERWTKPAAKGAAAALAALLIMMLGIFSHRQAGIWANGISLFEHAVEHTEGNFVAHNNLGAELYREKRFEEAVFHFQEAVRLNPNYFFAHNNIGIDYLCHEKFEEAGNVVYGTRHKSPICRRTPENGGCKAWIGKGQRGAGHYAHAIEIDPKARRLITISVACF